jgi:two-component system, OmpR family, sensor kinase
MKRSLQRHLSIMLGIAILSAGLVAATASFGLAYSEATEFQDDMLRQIAALKHGVGIDASSRQSGSDGTLADRESRVTITHLPGDPRPAWLLDDLPAGFHTVSAGVERLRVFVREESPDERVVVSQSTTARDEIAIDSAVRTLIPVLLLLPILIGLTVRIVRSEFAPITRLSANLDVQPADGPQPISDIGLPAEIIPFVQAINRLLERINRLVQQQRRFIADAAHELRTPLTALSLQAQNLCHADSLDAMKERAAPLQAGIERARHLTEQLLILARTQVGASTEVDVDVSGLARELIAEYLPLAALREIDLGMDEVTRLSMHTSPESLRLVLKNALENALKYSPPGGAVTLRLLSEIDSDVIEVIDSGPGIPPEEHERVFGAFYRLAETPEQGSGLGLAIAREAAARLGGGISLHASESGCGLIFRYRQKRER